MRVLMLCAHEPTMDPRVKWAAESATASFDVTVLGYSRADGSCPARESLDGYVIERLPHLFVNILRFPLALLGLLTPKLMLLGLLLAPVLAIPLVLVVLPLALLRLAKVLVRDSALLRLGPGRSIQPLVRAVKAVFVREPTSPAAAEARAERRLRSIRARISYVANLMRMQFGPPAVHFVEYLEAMPVKPDVVHCNDLDVLLVGALAKKRYGCRLVYDAHEYYPYCDPYACWLDIGLFSVLEKFLLRHVDGAVTVNEPMAELMSRDYGFRPIYAVPNAEPKAAAPVAPMATNMTRLAAGRVKCLFQGRYSPKRGMEEIILGWQHVDGDKAALFLRGPENNYTQEGRALAERLGLLNKSVYFLPAVTEDELVAAAAEADIGIVPYLPSFVIYEYACPNKFSQYMHAGLMVVSNNLPYVRSVMERAECGLIYDSKDPATLGAAINRVASDPALLQRFKAQSRAFAAQSFHWQAYSGIFDALYRGETPDLAPDGTVCGHS